MSLPQSHKRFLDIIKEKIKTNFKKYISSDQFITRSESDFVRISIPTINIPKLKYGLNQNNSSSSGEPDSEGGGGFSKKSKGQAQAGKDPGTHILDIDITFDELAEILREKLQLPRIQPKGLKNLKTDTVKYSTRSLQGSMNLRHNKESYKQALKRSIFIRHL